MLSPSNKQIPSCFTPDLLFLLFYLGYTYAPHRTPHQKGVKFGKV
jgi:hypothetical protein